MQTTGATTLNGPVVAPSVSRDLARARRALTQANIVAARGGGILDIPVRRRDRPRKCDGVDLLLS